MTLLTPSQTGLEEHRLHKPGVAGSSPAAATSVQICHTPAKVYHGWPETSCSQLKALRESPLGFYWRHVRRIAPPKSSEALAYGSLLHLWAELGDAEFWKRVVLPPDSLVTAAGALSAKGREWLATLLEDQIAVCPADESKLRDQTQALLANPEVQRIIADTVDAEFNIRWSMGGHAVRCRVDGATPAFFFDWKTTRDAAPERTWFRSVLDYGYHLQSAMYGDAALAIGYPAHRMRFIVTSTVWPYECFVCVLPERLIEKGRRECLRLLSELQTRMEWDCWHRLNSQEVCELYCPEWALKGE